MYKQNGMRKLLGTVSLFLICWSIVYGQDFGINWYSESENNGVIIQNSFPKGGPYKGHTTKHFNHSYLVFFTRVKNERTKPIELTIRFSGDSVAIPNSPDTYVQLFLPSEKMTWDKHPLFSYGLLDIGGFDQPSEYQKIIDPNEETLFYVVALFYQTKAEAWQQERGGNRAELVLKGQDLYYRMLPQIDALPCGHITIN